MSQIKIVNVEDYTRGRQAASDLLRLEGFDVIEAATGAEALEIVPRVQPHLVLLDVNLPDISGYDVCRRLKADYPTTPILQISGSFVSGPDRVRGLESGADAYLVKPVEPEELFATIRALLRMREAEESRRETEQRYELLFESSSLPTWIVDTATFDFLAVNRAAVAQYGWSKEEFLQARIQDIFPPEDVPALEEYFSKISGAVSNAVEWRHKTNQGMIIEAQVIWHELLYRMPPAACIKKNDITARRQAE